MLRYAKQEAIEFMTNESEIQDAWISVSKRRVEESENLIRMAKGEGPTDLLKDAEEIMRRVEEKYKELFAKSKQQPTHA